MLSASITERMEKAIETAKVQKMIMCEPDTIIQMGADDAVREISFVVSRLRESFKSLSAIFQVSVNKVSENFIVEFYANDDNGTFTIRHDGGSVEYDLGADSYSVCSVVHRDHPGDDYTTARYGTIVLLYKDSIIESLVSKAEKTIIKQRDHILESIGFKAGREIKNVTCVYTGGRIWLFHGQLYNGYYFLTDDNGCTVILDTDPSNFDESLYFEWQEEHKVEELTNETERIEFGMRLLDFIESGKSIDGACMEDYEIKHYREWFKEPC